MDKKRYFISFFLLLGFLVGVVHVSPHFFRAQELKKKNERYIPITTQGDFDIMNVHAARYREIVDGNFFAGEIDTYEHKDGPAIWPLLSADILSPFLVFFETIFPMFFVTDFLFPIFTFFSFFLLFLFLTKNRWYASLFSFFLMMFPQFPLLFPPSSFGEMKNILYQIFPFLVEDHIVSNLTYLRREAFIPGAPIFILSFYFLFRAFFHEMKKRDILLAGIFSGLLFYFYLYYWLFVFAVLGVYGILILFQKKKKDFFTLLKICFVAGVVSIPFWISHFSISSLSNYEELTLRAGIEYGRAFRFVLWKSYLLNIILGGLVLIFSSRLKKIQEGFFLSILCFAQIAVLNLHVFSGFNIQSDHWSGRVFLIVNGIVIGMIFWYVNELLSQKWQEKKYFRNGKVTIIGLSAFLILCIVVNNVFSQAVIAKRSASLFRVDQNIMKAYDWLVKNTEKDSVVLSPVLETNIDIPVYTHNRIFLARAQASLASEYELLDRLYFTYHFFDLPVSYIQDLLKSHRGIIYFFTAKYEPHTLDRFLFPEKYGAFDIPVLVQEQIIKDYENFLFDKKFNRYKVDYIFIGQRELNFGVKEEFLKLHTLLYTNDAVRIYKFH